MIFGEYVRQVSSQSHAKEIVELSDNGTLTNLIPAESCIHWNNTETILVQHNLYNISSSEADMDVVQDSELAVVSWARIDNREELSDALEVDENQSDKSNSWFIYKSYQKWGENCVDNLVGDFVFVVFDKQEEKLFCARDHMGIRPFYYYLSPENFIFTTHASFFHHLTCCELNPSSKWIAEFLSGLSQSFDKTPYPNILKLAPAHCLTVTKDESYLRKYFEFSGKEKLHLNSSQEYVDTYRKQLEEAIKCRIDSDGIVGTELSGGIDSSTISAYAPLYMKKAENQLHAFAFANCESEPEYIHAVTQKIKLKATHIFTRSQEDIEERQKIITKALSIAGYPEEFGNGTGHDLFYKMAENLNIRTLLSGFGGDDFVTASAGLVLTELSNEGHYLELYKAVKGNAVTRLLRVIKVVMNEKRKRKGKLNSAFNHRWQYQIIKREWVKEYNLHSRYIQTASCDVSYKTLNEYTLKERWEPFISARTETCSLMAAARGIEYRWPLLDVRLIKLFLSIPSIEKYNNGTSRLLHRKAIDHIVPSKVTWKPDKYMGRQVITKEGLSGSLTMINADVLHPRLIELIDVQKLNEQIVQFAKLKKAGPSDQFVQIYRNINNLLWLNQWLHQFH